jgi:NAD(P)-dependent dehydrogenase (short-subunit alcohol dehydrogenase family)
VDHGMSTERRNGQGMKDTRSGSNGQRLLQGKTALVTGAAQGVGKGIALELGRAGCTVVVNFRTSPALAEKTVQEINSLGGDAFAIQADVRSGDQIIAMFAEARRRLAKLDILVNNAGAQTWAPLLELTEADWNRDLETNLRGSFLCTQAAGRWMKEISGGSIINIGSGCNKVPFPRLVSYSASKGGLDMLTKVAAVELGHFRIRVNCVAPGAIVIERTKQENPEYESVWGNQAPLGRVGTPEDVGHACVFLGSDAASYVTGQTIWVDGGAFTQASWPYQLEDDPHSDKPQHQQP